jgi:hypothetical protein
MLYAWFCIPSPSTDSVSKLLLDLLEIVYVAGIVVFLLRVQLLPKTGISISFMTGTFLVRDTLVFVLTII